MIIKEVPPFSNSYIIKRFDQAILIDPSYNYELISSKLEGYKLVAILLTHAHANHMNLIGYFNCPVYMHRNEYKVFMDNDLNGYNRSKLEKPFKKDSIYIRFLDDKDIVKLADKEVEVIHTPGHTEGSVCYKYDNNVFVGDTLTINGVGKIKKIKGAKSQMNRSINKLFNLVPNYYNIYPGHGKTFLLKEIKALKKIKDILK